MDGYKELKRKFDQLSGKDQTRVLRSGVRAGAKVIAEEAASRIPVGEHMHRLYNGVLVAPGFAKRSIKFITGLDKRTGKVYALVGVRALAFYAVQFVELERGKSNQKGKPWLRPAFDSTRKQQIFEIEKRIKARIKRLSR